MSESPWFLSSEECSRLDASLLDELAGGKVAGLLDSRINPRPDFFVVTIHGAQEVAESKNLSGALEVQMRNLVSNLRASTEGRVSRGLIEPEDRPQFIVRSSVVGECLADRGRFDSRLCDPFVEAVWDAIHRLVEKVHLADETRRPAFIVQAFVRAAIRGHLSNERRVSNRRSKWRVQAWDEHEKVVLDQEFRPSETSTSIPTIRHRPLAEGLRHVVESFVDGRYHIEWLWDGRRVWLVQVDKVETPEGDEPGGGWTQRYQDFNHTGWRIWTPVNGHSDFPKIAPIGEFEAAGAKMPLLLGLMNSNHIRAIASDKVNQELSKELERMIRFPIVLRTDVRNASEPHLNLPRSDTIGTRRDIENFFQRIVDELPDLLEDDKLGVFAHRFLPGRAAAWAFGQPGLSEVGIDSSWGIAEGLSFNPHDTFVIDTKRSVVTRRTLRCKERYLDSQPDGTWAEKEAGKPWDLRSSLSDHEIREIGALTTALAEKRSEPVMVMFFVVRVDATRTRVLPWIAQTPPAEPRPDEAMPSTWDARLEIVIRNEMDLERLQTQVENNNKIAYVRLQPEARLVRENDFIERVGRKATAHGLPVLLTGSSLAHAFFVLRRTGARLIAGDRPYLAPRATKHGKLVRDLVPTMIQGRGERTTTGRVEGTTLIRLLRAKAIEESYEVLYAGSDEELISELADLHEVVQALYGLLGISSVQIEEKAAAKRANRGGFREGIFLAETRAVPLGAMRPLPNENERTLSDELRIPPRMPSPRWNLTEDGGNIASKLIIPLIPPSVELGGEFTIDDGPIPLVVQYDLTAIYLKLGEPRGRESASQQQVLPGYPRISTKSTQSSEEE